LIIDTIKFDQRLGFNAIVELHFHYGIFYKHMLVVFLFFRQIWRTRRKNPKV